MILKKVTTASFRTVFTVIPSVVEESLYKPEPLCNTRTVGLMIAHFTIEKGDCTLFTAVYNKSGLDVSTSVDMTIEKDDIFFL